MASYALLSDIHGNIDALRAVLDDLDAGPPVDQILCLGDIVGYCPAGNEVIERLRSLDERCTVRYNLGSHDAAVLGRYRFVDLQSDTDTEMLREAGLADELAVAEEYFNTETRRFVPVRPHARDAMKWTIEHLSDESKAFLRDRLERRIEVEPGILCVHGSPRDPECEYVRDSRFARRCFESPEMDGVWLCFVGHTHLPVAWRMPRSQVVEMAGSRVCLADPVPVFDPQMTLDRAANTYIVNVGSVGQPRDRDPRACYARFSSDDRTFQHLRVEYDIDAAAARIRQAGFSERLAERLYKGE